ncbi:MAG: sigma-70 family RNA polymerase sigma factor [Acidobacteriota bacterium]|jgi:RNA polymerase sigma factor (sigma-70 family)|nr:sigma-70 family RNA polymerase sigma factor [Acidobacteriota bacterium]
MEGERSVTAGLAEFLNREYNRLVAYVRRRLGDFAGMEPEDVVQEVLAGVFDRADISAPVHNLAAYVYQALRNRVVDAWRSRRDVMSIDASPRSGGSLAEVLADVSIDAVDQLELEEMGQWLLREIERLNPAEADLIRATEWEGRSFSELSREWGIPIGTLLARKSRALKKLRNRMRVSPGGKP